MEAGAKYPTAVRHEIVETRDSFLVRRAFMSMDREALDFLWSQLGVDSRADRDEIPDLTTATGREFLLHELYRSAAHSGRFFIVAERTSDGMFQVFVSSDSTVARSFSELRLNGRI